MKQVTGALLIIFFVTSGWCLEKEEILDVIVDKESNRVGQQAIQVGQILRECAQGIEVHVAQNHGLENETAEYFFKRLWAGVQKVVEKVANVIGRASEGLNYVTKAAEVITAVIGEKLGSYTLSDDQVSYQSCLTELGKNLDSMGKSLIQKGSELCSTCSQKKLGDIEKNFVKKVLSTL
uniref:Putative conserved secreted protein n=1 Tax=Ixodes scapularis TaxID=6945 RepID=A0A4D5S6Y5_IXOSC